jgi:two-component system, OmpR family, sensor kinase
VTRRPELRSLTVRLALLVAGITAAALAIVWFGVSQGLESTLRDQRLDALETQAERVARPVTDALNRSADRRRLDDLVRRTADATGSRVTLFGVTRGSEGVQVYVATDSTAQVEIRDLRFEVALDAARSGRTERGSEAAGGGAIGEVARPLVLAVEGRRRPAADYVLVVSEPLRALQESADAVERKLAVAAGSALIIAVVAGVLAGRGFSRRVRRMEGVARRVAAGDFSRRFELGSQDELAQLARALDDMQGQLAQLETARKRFIATASHELRTPIFSLGGFLELLEDEDLDPETRGRFTGQLREQVDRLGKLTTGLLDLSRLEAGSLELRPEPTDVSQLAEDVAAEFLPALAAHDSHLEVRVGDEPLEASCDPERVAQIIRILVDNALSHTPAGTDVVVAASRRDGRVRLAVTDFGTGIKRGAMDRIFEPFYTSDDAQGSGLGLAIAHELAERMRGELTVESMPGRTTSALEFPG